MTDAQIRILTLVFDGSAAVVGLIVVATMGMRSRNSAWRSRLKVAWTAFVISMCVRSVYHFAHLGTWGMVADAVFLTVVLAMIWYGATHRRQAGWWTQW